MQTQWLDEPSLVILHIEMDYKSVFEIIHVSPSVKVIQVPLRRKQTFLREGQK